MTAYPASNLISALPTLFDAHGEVDLGATKTAYAQLAETPLDGVFVAGTTGEFTTLTDDERLAVCAVAADAFGPERTYWHVGAASTHQAVRLTRTAVDLGARQLAVLTPYYFPATEAALLAYYEQVVAAAAGVPVYGYLFAARTTVAVPPALLAGLAATGLAGVKISGESTALVGEYVAALADRGIPVYSGADAEFAEVVAAGGAGVVSGVSSALPKPFLEVRDALRTGDADALAVARERAHRAVAVTRQGNLAHLKAVLELRGVPASGLRAPLDAISPEDRRALEADVADLL
ncbi:4-hydroxy-tetrahydrodipicolinate synthase [Micromonospora pallida]|uniref:4-hydroxy-tetrahydrodipicolinate synthase n=1 Tax=Micromonospora pallida TaxID=145854 RepID=A0A1C6S213_9ACTN|nr:dihydrodipicolinate synthase family protein [Micromonospora pallida]SCL23312.1 4-hydroxy-tetrahydrodipicolinate synthase [Micromonospora pallida]